MASTGRALLGPWFEANRIKPIFVVWQSGLLESAADILKTALEKIGVPAAAERSWLRSKINEVKDRAFEVFARDAGIKAIWENMKFRADGASQPGGGLMTAARELKAAIGDLESATKGLKSTSSGIRPARSCMAISFRR